MAFRSIRPLLWTDKLPETIAFYTTVLEFTITAQNEAWGWANLEKDSIEIMVSKPNEHSAFEKPLFTGSFYIITDEVDKWWLRVKDRVKIVYEPATFEWGMREFAIYDNNGYILQFGEEVMPGE